MAVQFKKIACSACGSEVDRVEYDPDAANPAVEQVRSALGIDEESAARLVARHNKDATRTQVERADELAKQIAGRSVEGRPEDTYACPQGCDADLEVV